MSSGNEYGNLVVTTWRDLQRKYARDKQAIRSTWASLSPDQRKTVILAGASGGDEGFLRHREDGRLGNVRYITPELNLKDLIPGENTLELLEQRATTPIVEMFTYDAQTMLTSMRVNGISHARGRKEVAVMVFIEEAQYGACMEFTLKSKGDQMERMIQMGNGYIVNENEGLMILERQVHIYSCLSILVDEIMDMKRMLDDPDEAKKLPKRRRAALRPEEKIENTLQRLEVSGNSKKSGSKGAGAKRPPKDTFDRLAQDSQEQFLSVDDHINLIREEPLYFSHVANNYYFSSPGMVPDGKGVIEPIYNSNIATRSTLGLLRDAYQATAYWKYLSVLASELAKNSQHTTEKVGNPLSNELWATCTKELLRARNVYRRFVQTELKYSKFFVRDESGSDGLVQVKFKDTLETVAKKSGFTYWILQLGTKTELSDSEVAKLLKSLDNFQETVPKARELISERMGDALADISVIVAFMARLREVITVPKQALPSGFEKKIAARSAEVEAVWSGIDIADYVFPVDNLKQPAAAQDCLRIINERLSSSELGADMGNIFQGTAEDSVLEVFGKFAESEDAGQKINKDVPFDPFINPPSSSEDPKQPTDAVHPKPKRQHETPMSETVDKAKKYFATDTGLRKPLIQAEPVTASSAAVKTLRKLFRQDPSAARSGIPWTAFVSAMTNIGFTVEPVGGSIARFRPPEGLGAGGSGYKPINLHRPHPTDKLEGWALFRLVSRLKRSFGWSADTFVTGKK